MASWRDDPAVLDLLGHGATGRDVPISMEIVVAARDHELRQAIEAMPSRCKTKRDILSLLGDAAE